MPAKKRATIVRQEIPMKEALESYVGTCRLVPGALCRLSTFRSHVKDHCQRHLERRYRWRRTEDMGPLRITRRTVCKDCGALRPSKDTCGEHFDEKKHVKASFVCGIVIPDENPVKPTAASDASSNEDEEVKEGKGEGCPTLTVKVEETKQ